MAAEYSRELSAKVFAGQSRLASYGFRQGGQAGFGLRRMLVDANGSPKAELAWGERKALQNDRVILVPGPSEEVETVRRIYRMFASEHLSETEIARRLNAEGASTGCERPWSRTLVLEVLRNEKYIGNYVYAKGSGKLKTRRRNNAEEHWIRANGAFAALVDERVFKEVRAIFNSRRRRHPDAAMLQLLRALYEKTGWLSQRTIDGAAGVPSTTAYRSRFGSLGRAYQLIGYTPPIDLKYIEINRKLREMYPAVLAETIEGVRAGGGEVEHDPETQLLILNREFTVSMVIARCTPAASGQLRWNVRLDMALRPDLSVVIRMDTQNDAARDYYLLPRIDVGQLSRLTLAEDNGSFLDAYRFDTLLQLFHMSSRSNLRAIT
jgi:hypothetical protein